LDRSSLDDVQPELVTAILEVVFVTDKLRRCGDKATRTGTEDALDTGVFLLRLVVLILGILCIAAAFFVLILEVFRRL
jgi:hypothetical protein